MPQRASEAPPLPRRAVTSVPSPVASRTFAAPVAKPVVLGDEEQVTKLFSGATTEKAELVVVAGQYKGKTVSLGAGTVVIGRSGDCELSLKGATGASRRHCKVQYLGNRFVVIDLESRNGTVVNGQSVERKVLEQGDQIELGDEVIQFIIHRLVDLAIIDDGLNPVELTGSKTVRSPEPAPPRPVPVVVPAANDSGVATAPPQPALTSPVVVVVAPAPIVYPPPPPPPSRTPYVFSALAIVVLGGGAALVNDRWTSEPDADPAVITTVVDAGSGPVIAAVVDAAGAPVVTAAVDAGSAQVVGAIVDAGAPVVVAVVDAGAPVVVAIVDAGMPIIVAAPGPAGSVQVVQVVQVVRASAAGRASVIKVKVGDRVAVGDVLMVLGGDNGTMARKLQALQREEREFAEAANKDSNLKADLEQIRREIKKVAARLETAPLKATHAGVVVEVLVKENDVVRDAAPIVTLSP